MSLVVMRPVLLHGVLRIMGRCRRFFRKWCRRCKCRCGGDGENVTFKRRKWLPQPLRKLSQGKVDKSQSPVDTRPPLKKTGSDKRIKVPATDMGNKSSVSEGEEDDDRHTPLKGAKSLGPDIANGDEQDEECVLPPPMKPFDGQSILVPQPSPGVPGIPEIQENPSKREQHSENKHSVLRNTRSSEAISEYSIDGQIKNIASSSNEAGASAYSGDESDRQNEVDPTRIEHYMKQREYVLRELVDTEKAYVTDLSLIVDGYIATMRDPNCEIPMPDDLKDGKDKMVFGNIERIYNWHKKHFLPALEAAQKQPEELGEVFKKHERNLHMYDAYCKNKPISDHIVSEYMESYFEALRRKLGHKLQLFDLLIKPVQRITKYNLLLKEFLKYTERAGLVNELDNVRAAYKISVIIPKNANDMMDVGRLQGFEEATSTKLIAQGKLLLHGVLSVCDSPGQNILGKTFNKMQVFLFEQSIIFSEIVGKKTQFTSPNYIYKAHIQVNKMNLGEIREDGSFVITSTEHNNPGALVDISKTSGSATTGFECVAATEELRVEWLKTLKEILQRRDDFVKAIESPIAYIKERTNNQSEFPWEIRREGELNDTSPIKSPRKPPHYIHKANTIGIPSESELSPSDSSDHKHGNHKSRGIWGLGRNKHKSDTSVTGSGKDGEKNDLHRRWVEGGQNSVT